MFAFSLITLPILYIHFENCIQRQIYDKYVVVTKYKGRELCGAMCGSIGMCTSGCGTMDVSVAN